MLQFSKQIGTMCITYDAKIVTEKDINDDDVYLYSKLSWQIKKVFPCSSSAARNALLNNQTEEITAAKGLEMKKLMERVIFWYF